MTVEPSFWEPLVHVLPSVITPIIAGGLTIWGVNIAANRADQRRGEDANEARTQYLIGIKRESYAFQREAVIRFLTKVREEDSNAQMRINALRWEFLETDPAEMRLVDMAKLQLKESANVHQLFLEMGEAYQVLDLSITHENVRNAVEAIEAPLEEYGKAIIKFSEDFSKLLQENNPGDQISEEHLLMQTPPKIGGSFLNALTKLREEARRCLTDEAAASEYLEMQAASDAT